MFCCFFLFEVKNVKAVTLNKEREKKTFFFLSQYTCTSAYQSVIIGKTCKCATDPADRNKCAFQQHGKVAVR